MTHLTQVGQRTRDANLSFGPFRHPKQSKNGNIKSWRQAPWTGIGPRASRTVCMYMKTDWMHSCMLTVNHLRGSGISLAIYPGVAPPGIRK